MLPNEYAQIGAVQPALDDHGQAEAVEQKVEAGRAARDRRLAMVNLNLTEAKQKILKSQIQFGNINF